MIIPVGGRLSLSLLEKQIVFHHLNQGGILAFPTDTLYGLGVKAGLSRAVDQLYTVKKRDKTKPLILLGASIEQFQPYTTKPQLLRHPLLSTYWPGPLTVVLPFERSSGLYFGQDDPQSIGMRIPNHILLLELLSFLDFPLLTTSANPSDSTPLSDGPSIQDWLLSASSSECVVLDSGEIENLPSTVIQVLEAGQIEFIREGVLSKENLLSFSQT